MRSRKLKLLAAITRRVVLKAFRNEFLLTFFCPVLTLQNSLSFSNIILITIVENADPIRWKKVVLRFHTVTIIMFTRNLKELLTSSEWVSPERVG